MMKTMEQSDGSSWVVCEVEGEVEGIAEESTTIRDQFHVLPMGDLKDHTTTPDCWCRPRFDEEWWDMHEKELYIHNSYDRREHTYEKGRTH